MINFSGLPTNLALKVIDRTKDAQLEIIESSAVHQRRILAFGENAPNVESVEDFVEDYDTFSFVMRAFDLEAKIFGKALFKEVLSSDISDPASLVRRLNDPKITDLYKAMDFKAEGTTNLNTISSTWREGIVDRYVETQFVNQHAESNESVGIALEVKQKAPSLKTWLGVLGDPDVAQFMRTALGIPDEVIYLDVKKQAAKFEEKYDIEKLQDPEELDKLITRFAVLADVKNPQSGLSAGSAALDIMMSTQNSFASFGLYDYGATSGVSRALYG
jgi:hypothetical protein